MTTTSDAPAGTSADLARRPLANLALLLAAAWIATGALYKWLAGSPNDLPPMLHELPLAIDVVYRLAIGIELGVIALVLLRPRIGWLFVSAQYVVFLGILVVLMVQGSASCGCFGSKVTMPPAAMAAIDGALLALVLGTRPWSARLWSTPLPVAALALVLGLAAPWLYDRGSAPTRASGSGGDVAENGDGGSGARPGWHVLEVETWEGSDVLDIDLATFLPEGGTTLMPGTWVLYRDSCPHCAEHLREMAFQDPGDEPITLIRIPEDLGPESVVVDLVPQGAHVVQVDLEGGIDYVLQAPVDLRVEYDLLVSRVRDADAMETDGAPVFPTADPEVLRAARGVTDG